MDNHDSQNESGRLPRRTVLQWFAAAATAGPTAIGLPSLGQEAGKPGTTGYGTDPDLVTNYQPGDVWPLTFTESQRGTVAALADTLLPADDLGPAASELRVPDYVDEWISAPYPAQQSDRKTVLPGLEQWEKAVRDQTGGSFVELSPADRANFCTKVVADPKHPLGAFLHRFTLIAAGAYFSSPEGWNAIGYTGNMASVQFAGPPPEVLERVGVVQTVTD